RRWRGRQADSFKFQVPSFKFPGPTSGIRRTRFPCPWPIGSANLELGTPELGTPTMAKRLDHILVIDIEATCWEGGFPPRGQANDVIEIGLCPLELATGRRLEKRSILVRPERSTVSPFCTELTTLTQEQVSGGIAVKDACRILEVEYPSAERP